MLTPYHNGSFEVPRIFANIVIAFFNLKIALAIQTG